MTPSGQWVTSAAPADLSVGGCAPCLSHVSCCLQGKHGSMSRCLCSGGCWQVCSRGCVSGQQSADRDGKGAKATHLGMGSHSSTG